MQSLDEEVEVAIPMVSDTNVSIENPIRAVKIAPEFREAILANRRRLAERVERQIDVYANGGSGWLLWNQVADDVEVDSRLDWLVNSHHFERVTRDSERMPPVRGRLIGTLGLAHVDDGTVLQRQPLDRFGYAGVPSHVARSLLCAGRVAWDRLEQQVSVVTHESIPVPERWYPIEAAVVRTVTGMTAFDPAAWAWWRENPGEDQPARSLVVHVVLPEWVDGVGGQIRAAVRTCHDGGVRVRLRHADVEVAHVLTFQTLDEAWVRDLRRDAVAYLDDRLRAEDNLLRDEWEWICQCHGCSDPVGRWEQYRANRLDHRLD
jgi:hypothetical protein